MNITTISDLINYLDCGVELNSDHLDFYDMTLERAARVIRDMPNCPEYGDDWTDFLSSLDVTTLICDVAEQLEENLA